MRIAVFARYAPDPATVELVAERGRLDGERLLYKLGRADLSALEQAVRLAESSSAGQVVAFCVAPPGTEKLLKSLYAGGANEVIRLWGSGFDEAGTPEMAQAQLLAGAIKDGGFDLVLGGAVGSEGNSDVIGPALAAYLNLPQICNVAQLEIRLEGQLYAERKLERGEREAVACVLPAVVTLAEGSLEARYPAMPAYLAALRKAVELKTAEATPVKVRQVALIPPRPRPKKLPRPSDSLPYFSRIDAILAVTGGDKKGNIFEGSPDEMAERILAFLVSNKLL